MEEDSSRECTTTLSLQTADDVERVFLRLVNADTDAKLQAVTDRFLGDVLELAGKKQEHIQLVTELLTHFNKVVKNNSEIRLPLFRLLELFQGEIAISSNLSLIYLKMAKDRIGSKEQLEVLPVYLKSFSRKPNDLDYIFDVFSLCLPGLQELAKQERKNWPPIEIDPDNVEILSRCFRAVLSFNARSIEEIKSIMDRQPAELPGLSFNEHCQIGKKVFPVKLNLAETKVMILKVLAKELVTDQVAFPLIVLASASKLNEVDDLAESILKKLPTESLIEEKTVVDKLMSFYLGSEADAVKPQDAKNKIPYGNQFVQSAILPYLSKSKLAPTVYMNNLKICLNGCESQSARVQTLTMNFYALVAENMPLAALQKLGPGLFSRLNKLTRTRMNTLALCGAYRCLSIFGSRHPSLVLNDTEVVTKMFTDLSNENLEDVAGAIVSCLTTWLPLFLEEKQEQKRAKLREVIRELIRSDNSSCRLASLKYTEALIGEQDMDLRWQLIQASGDERDTIRSEALRQLEKSLQKPAPPTTVVIGSLWSSLQKDYRHTVEESTSSVYPCYKILVHQNASRYLYAILETIVMEQPAQLRIVEGDDHWLNVVPRIVTRLHNVENIDMIKKATEMALYSITDSTDVHLVRIASCFVAAFRAFPHYEGTRYPNDCFQFAINPCLQKLRDSTRMEFSSALAYLLTALVHNDETGRSNIFNVSKAEFIEKEIPGLAFTCASMMTSVLGATFNPPVVSSEFIQSVYLPFIKNGYNRPTSTLESTLGALAFILQNDSSALDYANHKEIISELIVHCEKIAVSRQDSFTQKTREYSAKVIGLLSGDFEKPENEDNYKTVLESLIRFGEGPPQQELQLIVGEAIVDSILGRWSLSKRDYYLVDGGAVSISEWLQTESRLKIVNDRIISFINKTLEHKKSNANQHFRKAELVWLLIVVQRFSKLNAESLKVGELLVSVQQAFADGLTENDEFSQDISAKGMGIVYGLADEPLKKGLVDSLMSTLSEGKRSETKVDANTKLFENGQLGTTPTGGKLTTYQELLTLASDLNQPDLVYKFMQLARHNATWNSRMGAAHGFGALLENAKEEIEPYFKQLVPKLFRLRYDPDIKVQSAMKSIWAILTADRKNVVDEFANEIAKELLPALTDREYRVRESACLALSDLLRGHDTVEMHRIMPDYLEAVLRVRDDVKQSVREAADKAADAISKLIVRLGSSNNVEKANEFLSIALPAVIDQGILKSTVKSNSRFCLSLVLDLTKSAGKQLKPYIADLIPLLMDAVSDNEHVALNYLAVRANQQQMEALDDARAGLARTSPMMTAVNDLLPYIDSKVLIDMTPKVSETLRSSVGTSTRSSAAQFITQLALRAPQLLIDHTPQCDKLFSALIPGVRDRNPSIRKQFANAMSYLAKFASANQMKKLINTVIKDLTGSDEELKTSSCHVISNLAANSQELLKGYTSLIVPYVFLEKCREVPKEDEAACEKQEKWNEVWAELVPSTSSAVRLYKEEILKLAMELVTENDVWAVRKQAAVMIGTTFNILKEDSGVDIARRAALCLLENLNGRIWDGKAEVLKSLSSAFEAGGKQLKANLEKDVIDEIVKVLKREASKKNVDYAGAGLSTLATWCAITEDVESANWLIQKVSENISRLIGPRENDDSDDNMEGLSNLEIEIRISKLVTLNLIALAISLPTFNNANQAERALSQLSDYVISTAIAWKSKQFLFVKLASIFEKWEPREPVGASKLFNNILDQAEELCNQQRKTVAADALQVVLRVQDKSGQFDVDWNCVIDRVKNGSAGNLTGLGKRFDAKMETN